MFDVKFFELMFIYFDLSFRFLCFFLPFSVFNSLSAFSACFESFFLRFYLFLFFCLYLIVRMSNMIRKMKKRVWHEFSPQKVFGKSKTKKCSITEITRQVTNGDCWLILLGIFFISFKNIISLNSERRTVKLILNFLAIYLISHYQTHKAFIINKRNYNINKLLGLEVRICLWFKQIHSKELSFEFLNVAIFTVGEGFSELLSVYNFHVN